MRRQSTVFYYNFGLFWSAFIEEFPDGFLIDNDDPNLEKSIISIEAKGFEDIIDFWREFLEDYKDKSKQVWFCYCPYDGPFLAFYSSGKRIGGFNLDMLQSNIIMQSLAENDVNLKNETPWESF